ncbi:MAG TPA: hypothetical protein ENN51_01150 [candidate division WOR-3 bacterium]|uniref:Lrp/AsnC family transcriptional regulator n=1 Tax=candidate division WOR-3 bacterium TaxID=2052148 RepID=A0A7V0T4N5_UNCW3|nr:hypothetical protein [candidate division WOR-3 bacterium]
MLIERLDVAAIRLCEQHGLIPPEQELAAVGLADSEFRQRLHRLTALGVIRSFHATLVVPPLVGGDWVWGSVLATVSRPLGIANLLARQLPFVTELLLNSSLPAGVGPNLALLFYSRDFETEARYIRSVSGIEYAEVGRIADYSFPVSRQLSTEEKGLLRRLAAHPAAGLTVSRDETFRPSLTATLKAFGDAVGQTPDWVRAKLDRLFWTPVNGTGVVRVLPELDWTRVENFGHFHFLLNTGHRPDQLARLIADSSNGEIPARGFELVLGGNPYRGRYVQVEADCWGVAEMMERVNYLNQIAGISVQAVLLNQGVVINSGWVPGLLE